MKLFHILTLSALTLNCLAPFQKAQACFISSVQTKTLYSCTDARNIADAGVEVLLTQDVSNEVTTLEVSEQSIAGPRLIGKVVVQQQPAPVQKMSTPLVYKGQDLELSMQLDAPTPQGAPSFIRGKINGVKLDNDLFCRAIPKTRCM